MHRTNKYSQHSSIIWPVWPNSCVLVYELSGCGFESRFYHLNLRYGAWFKLGVPWHLGKLQSVDSLWKLVRDMIITYSQMHSTDKYSEHSSIIRPVWLNDWVFVYQGIGREKSLGLRTKWLWVRMSLLSQGNFNYSIFYPISSLRRKNLIKLYLYHRC